MDRKGGTQAGHSKIQARDGQTQPEHQQDASRTWPEEAGHREGMARCKQVMGRYRLGRGRTQPEQAGPALHPGRPGMAWLSTCYPGPRAPSSFLAQ